MNLSQGCVYYYSRVLYVYEFRCEFESSSDEVYSIQYHVIKFVSDLRQVSGFLLVVWSPPPIKLTATI